MRHCVAIQSARLVAAALLGGLLFAITAIPLVAQPAAESHPGRGLSVAYDTAHEFRFSGTVQEVVSKRVIGSPVGLHLLIAGGQSTVDVHVGPFLSKDTVAALHMGLPIQVVGSMEQLNGKQYMYARQLIFGGRTVTVRTKNGFLVRTIASRRAASRSRREKDGFNGGVR